MGILNGWKEIAECLQRTPRSARRWERLGLPVRRVSDSRRSPVVAFSNEIENWVRRKQVREDRLSPPGVDSSAFHSTWRETEKLLQESRQLRAEQRQLRAEQRQLRAQQRQLRAEQQRLRAEQRQLFDAVYCVVVTHSGLSSSDLRRELQR